MVRFVGAAIVLAFAAVAFQAQLVGTTMPLFRAWLGAIDDTYRTVDLSVLDVKGEFVVQRIATPAHPHAMGEHVVYTSADTRLTSQAAAGLVLQPLVLALALLIAWPWQNAVELSVRFAVATPLTLLVVLLDVPMMLYGFTWYQEISLLDPDRFSPLACWADVMNAGGRFALAVVAATLSIFAGSISIARGNLAASSS
ncbi:MAG TPA: hypothetical protein VH183_14305 [Burkholderiaceae bacterium]|nr:hypothetical protein [Burkholderiaceae bacterium]